MEKKYNTRSPAVKRLMREALEMSEATSDYTAAPLEENLFEWHFTVRGPEDSEFQGGIYHGRIIVPAEYPMKPPDIILLTPNGRFEVGKKICLSISGHHPETWQPSWSIRTALLAIIAFMPTPGQGTIGSLDYSPEERRALARRSRAWSCPHCGDTAGALLEPSQGERSEEQQREMEEIVQNVAFKSEEEKIKESGQKKQEEESPGETVPAPVTATATPSSPPSSNTVTTTVCPTSPPPRPPPPVSSTDESLAGGNRLYDLLILLLVAGIAALLYRRVNIMQD